MASPRSSTIGKSTLITTSIPSHSNGGSRDSDDDDATTQWFFKIENPRSLREDVLAELPQLRSVNGVESAQMTAELKEENQKLKERIEQMEKKMAEIVASNRENVDKFRQHLQKLQVSSARRLGEAQAANIALRKQLEATIPAKSTASTIQVIKPKRPANRPPHPEDVFVLKDNDNLDLCVKLPLKIQLLADDCLKVLDGDINSVDPEEKARRQNCLLNAAEILFNPSKLKMSPQRKQHLIWLLLLNLFNKYGFKSTDDRYVFPPPATPSCSNRTWCR